MIWPLLFVARCPCSDTSKSRFLRWVCRAGSWPRKQRRFVCSYSSLYYWGKVSVKCRCPVGRKLYAPASGLPLPESTCSRCCDGYLQGCYSCERPGIAAWREVAKDFFKPLL